MAVIRELIRSEEDGSISFGNYELSEKTKKSDFKHSGDIYKVKTFNELTRLERNELFVYESVPGTAVQQLSYTELGMKFAVEGKADVQITVEAEADAAYDIYLDGELRDTQKTNLGGKLSFSVDLEDGKSVSVEIAKK